MKSAPLDQDDPNGLLQRCLNDYTTELLQNKNKKTKENNNDETKQLSQKIIRSS